ncbi:N-acetylmuramoyl-L-alanine amidase [Candidatus Poribacteria bacterium]|nr:N-acetylmuramoyl-L-alanine amidase [Candidatus Poribacteria bacterium]
MKKPLLSLICIALIVLTGCGEKHEKPDALNEPKEPNEWRKLPQANFGIPPYARYLEGIKICLDPGHGGQAHLLNYKRGPTGLREAEVNLHVALYLREFLKEAGAIVFMTRTDDSFVSLPDRSEIANENAVDFFISLHHNWFSDPETNYTSTWYHQDADESRASLDLARYVQQSVADALRMPQFTPTGLYSDRLVIPSGFGVLRLTKRPAILVEASFYSSPEEEQRLKKESYNKREAYGYFIGIARYVAAGFPKGVLLTPLPESSVETKKPRIEIRVEDGLHERGAWMLKRQQVFSDSIRVKLDGVIVPHQYLRAKDLIVITPPKPLSNGVHIVETNLVNYYGNHSLPGGQWFKVAPPAAKLKLRAWTKTLPPDGASYVGITATALDKNGLSIADDEPIYAQTSIGRLAETESLSQNGEARFYLHTDATQPQPGRAQVKVAYKNRSETITIHFEKIRGGIVQGSVHDVFGNTISDAAVQLMRKKNRATTTNPDGHFFFDNVLPGDATLNVSKAGYYGLRLETNAPSNSAQVLHPQLHPIADGTLIGKAFVLDARYGGSERGTPITNSVAPADLNLAVSKALKGMLELAGASVHLIREKDEKIPVSKRVKIINAVKHDGYYLRIDHGAWVKGEPSVIATGYPGNQVAEDYLKAILNGFNMALFQTPIETYGDEESPEIRSTNKIALALEIRSINHPHLPELVDSPALITQEAYAIFLGTWKFLKNAQLSDEEFNSGATGEVLPQKELEIRIVDATSQQPVAGARVALDSTFPLVTNRAGKATFHGVHARRYRIVVEAAGYAHQTIELDFPDSGSVSVEIRK